MESLADKGGVGGGAAQHGRTKVPEDGNLPLGVAGEDGDNGSAQLGGAAVKSQAAGKQAITIGDMYLILLGGSHGHQLASNNIVPDIQVLPGIAYHDLLSGGSGGGMQPHHILHGNGKQPIGIGIPQVLFIGKGQLVQVVHRLNVLRTNSLFVHQLFVIRHVVIGMAHLLDQALILPGTNLLPRGAFNLGLIIPFQWIHPSLTCVYRDLAVSGK